MYTPLSFIEKKAEDHRLKNKSYAESENFTDTDLSGFCKLAHKVNQINDQLRSFQFTRNMITPITFTNENDGFSCP